MGSSLGLASGEIKKGFAGYSIGSARASVGEVATDI